MRAILAALLLAAIVPAHAADKALILNDQEQSAYRAILDTAVRASGLSPLSRNAFILSDKLDAAGTVTERKTDPPPNPEPKPSDGQP